MSETPRDFASETDDTSQALALLRTWHARQPADRKDPTGLGSLEVQRLGPMQVALTSVYEARGVHYKLSAAPSRPAVQDEGPDPWASPIKHPEGVPVGSELRHPLPNGRVQMDCGLCSGRGDMTCPTCRGTGNVPKHNAEGRSGPCPTCRGRGEMTCTQCKGSGGMTGIPTVWSRIEQHEELRVLDAPELPLDVLSDLMDGDDGGDLEHLQEGPRVEILRRQGGYREANRDDALSRLVANVCENPGVPSGARVHRQRLEVRRVPVYRVKPADEDELWIYGDPPRVVPPRALETLRPKLERALPWFAGVFIFATIFTVAWFLR